MEVDPVRVVVGVGAGLARVDVPGVDGEKQGARGAEEGVGLDGARADHVLGAFEAADEAVHEDALADAQVKAELRVAPHVERLDGEDALDKGTGRVVDIAPGRDLQQAQVLRPRSSPRRSVSR